MKTLKDKIIYIIKYIYNTRLETRTNDIIIYASQKKFKFLKAKIN